MKIKIKKKMVSYISYALIAGLLIFTFVSSFISLSFITEDVFAANITNISVTSRVNVTNTEPNITLVAVDDSTPLPANTIDLTANGVKVVTCNATIFDFNGVADIAENRTNATFFIESVGSSGTPDNNHLYRNESCNECANHSPTNMSCACKFTVQYYANDSSSWRCNVTVYDKGGTQKNGLELNFSDSEVSGAVTISKLLAINTTTLLDYGNLSVTQTSEEVEHNVTNVGNINVNLTLRGYGGTNNGEDYPAGLNLTMICDYGNITQSYQRYSVGQPGTAFGDMKNLTNSSTRTNLTLMSRVNDALQDRDRNSTYWRVQIPLGVGGICTGTILFGAIDAEV